MTNIRYVSGSLLLSDFAYTVLDQLSGPLLDFQRRWQAHALYPGLAVTKAMRRWRSTVAPQRPPQWALRGPASNPRKQGLSAFTVRRQKLPSLRKRKFQARRCRTLGVDFALRGAFMEGSQDNLEQWTCFVVCLFCPNCRCPFLLTQLLKLKKSFSFVGQRIQIALKFDYHLRN